MTVDTALGFTSVAGSLEPLAGAALAINLAYLGLTRFRYRDQIRKAAEQQRKVFEPADKPVPENIRNMKNYKQLCDLCDLSNFDIEDVPNANKGAKINGGVWSWFYHHLYRKHKDRYITYTFVGLSGFTLCAGVAKSLETWYYVNYLYHPNVGPIWLYLLMVAASSPVFFVWVGRKIVFYAAEHARECREEIELAMQTGPANATIPATASNVVNIEPSATAPQA